MFEQYTYSNLKKQDCRDDIQEAMFSSIGTQAGNFGMFNEHFRAVSKIGAERVKSELCETAEILGVTYDELMQTMPDLKKLLA